MLRLVLSWRQDVAITLRRHLAALSFSGDSGPYLQYVCVRIGSMLAKASEQGILKSEILNSKSQTNSNVQNPNEEIKKWAGCLEDSEKILLRKLYQFPEVIISSTLEYKPNFLCTYLFDLAQAYNDFYLACPVLKAETEVAFARLALSASTLQVLKNGLKLLGIEVPEKM